MMDTRGLFPYFPSEARATITPTNNLIILFVILVLLAINLVLVVATWNMDGTTSGIINGMVIYGCSSVLKKMSTLIVTREVLLQCYLFCFQ